MNPIEKVRVIARAKFSDKSNLGDWYTKRKSICKICPLNSRNKKSLTIKEAAVVSLNLGKPTCLACGCEIAAKASVRGETCGLVKKGEEPLWESLPEVEKLAFNDFHIENLSSDVVSLSLTEDIVLDYGDMERGQDSKFEISIKDTKGLTTKVETLVSCSCTTSTPKKIGDTYFVSISYNTDIVGDINKSIIFRLNRDGKEHIFKGKLIGKVKN